MIALDHFKPEIWLLFILIWMFYSCLFMTRFTKFLNRLISLLLIIMSFTKHSFSYIWLFIQLVVYVALLNGHDLFKVLTQRPILTNLLIWITSIAPWFRNFLWYWNSVKFSFDFDHVVIISILALNTQKWTKTFRIRYFWWKYRVWTHLVCKVIFRRISTLCF